MSTPSFSHDTAEALRAVLREATRPLTAPMIRLLAEKRLPYGLSDWTIEAWLKGNPEVVQSIDPLSDAEVYARA